MHHPTRNERITKPTIARSIQGNLIKRTQNARSSRRKLMPRSPIKHVTRMLLKDMITY